MTIDKDSGRDPPAATNVIPWTVAGIPKVSPKKKVYSSVILIIATLRKKYYVN